MQLYNRIDKKVLKEQIEKSEEEFTVISFYKYHSIHEPEKHRDELYRAWYAMGVLGRIYIAREGINAQLAVPTRNLDIFNAFLDTFSAYKGMRRNYAVEHNKSFYKLKIQVRDKIVADGIEDPSFDPSNCGVHLDAAGWNKLMEHPEVTVVDFRNHYESEVGHFQNAILPDVDTFREQLPKVAEELKDKKDKPILMYCTGGIRCEKASAYMKHQGFHNVYQLEGGIIKYANDCKKKGLEPKFIGKNFVFDDRLGERITEDIIAQCHQCGAPADTHINCMNEACHLLFIQCESCAKKYDKCCSEKCKDVYHLPLETQKELRKGLKNKQMIFRKGRAGHLRTTPTT